MYSIKFKKLLIELTESFFIDNFNGAKRNNLKE